MDFLSSYSSGRTRNCRGTVHDTHSIVRMEYVRGGRVVDDDDAAQVTAQAIQVLHVVAAVEHAAVAEQPCAEHAPSANTTF